MWRYGCVTDSSSLLWRFISTTFVTQQNTMSLRLIDDVLRRDVCETLLGFHTLTCWDQTGKFYRH